MEMMDYLRFGLALLFVLGLIAGCSWLANRMGLAPRVSTGPAAKRLSVTEIQRIDARRRLMLIRRDNVEHLILLNGDQDLLIESGIECSPRILEDAHGGSAFHKNLPRIIPFLGRSRR